MHQRNKRAPLVFAIGTAFAVTAGIGVVAADSLRSGTADPPAVASTATPDQCREAMSQLNLYRAQQNTAASYGNETTYWVYEGMQVSITDWMIEHGC